MSSQPQGSTTMSQASIYDTLRVLQTVVGPTLGKGVIKRHPWIEAAAQHLGLDTDAVQLLQELRKKYGSGPLLLRLPFRSQVLLLDPKDVSQVLNSTPVPFGSATKEKISSLRHFEPNHILIADPERRSQLRPMHETALATGERVHPFTKRFQAVIDEELTPLIPASGTTANFDWPAFSKAWYRIIRRIVLGDAARSDDQLTSDLDDLRRRANGGFMMPVDNTKLEHVQARLASYIDAPEEGSLVTRLPRDGHGLDLESQIAHWLFAFDPAGIAVFRALALSGCHAEEQARVAEEARDVGRVGGEDRRVSGAVFLESVRLYPTTPAILRELSEDAVLGGHKFQKGTGVIVFAPFFHRDGERLEFADRLVPEQWSDREMDLAKGLVPFSAGPAICPAHNLVPMVGGIAIDAVVGRARIELVQPQLDPKALLGTLDHTEVKLELERR
ncbi:hypothetical protein VTI74DRAFT_4973 [Chaetomium olivicolor]